MKTTKLRILLASALLFVTASAQALQPELLYAFQRVPEFPTSSLVQGSDGDFYGTTYSGVFKVTTNGVSISLASFTNDTGAYPPGLVFGSDGSFYGTSEFGGSRNHGTVFKVTTNGVLTPVASFTGTNGGSPRAALVLGNDGNFYGTTSGGGSDFFGPYTGSGTVFKVTTNGVLTTLVSFTGTNGAHPQAELVLSSDGNFYGTTRGGGSSGNGTVFRVTTNGVLTSLVSFSSAVYDGRAYTNANGALPYAGLVLGSGGDFYGTTAIGGSSGFGTVFKVTPNGMFTSLVSFNGDNGANPYAALVLGNDGNLYGATSGNNLGTVFRVTPAGELTTLLSLFNGATQVGLVLGRDGNLYGITAGGMHDSVFAPGVSYPATIFKVTPDGVLITLASFISPHGAHPTAKLAAGSDGTLYGTTTGGGSSGNGTVFRVTTNGLLTSLASFTGTNGAYPEAGLVLGNNGHFYGTTIRGGSNNRGDRGTIFKVATNGVLTSFALTNSWYPRGGLVLGRDGNFYGTTGQDTGGGVFRTVFRVTTNGVLTTLVSHGGGPSVALPVGRLVLGHDGDFYGMTRGSVFKVTTNGIWTSLAGFNGTNGWSAGAGLVPGSDGNFYGTTEYGGSNYKNANDASDLGYGTVFKVTPDGVLTSLASFTGNNGAYPRAELVLGNDGNFYGTTANGGSDFTGPFTGSGTVFKVTPSGVLTTLVSFTGNNGAHPLAGLILGNDGSFYGTTANGGPGGGGTIFRLVISAFTNVARQPGGGLSLTGTGPANGAYRLWANTDLSLPVASWMLLTNASFDSNGNFSHTDAGAATNPSRFYQLSVP